uniref:Ovule protein n=1 Tax=Acrobeloides nanus TaxID=290746 RepID=A0A914D4V3_9BILA
MAGMLHKFQMGVVVVKETIHSLNAIRMTVVCYLHNNYINPYIYKPFLAQNDSGSKSRNLKLGTKRK